MEQLLDNDKPSNCRGNEKSMEAKLFGVWLDVRRKNRERTVSSNAARNEEIPNTTIHLSLVYQKPVFERANLTNATPENA